nr:modulator protein [Escherichia coli]
MLRQHQDSLLPRFAQGEEAHETTGKRPYLVRINRVLHVVDIHTPDPESPVRSPAEGRIQGSYGNNGLRIRR